MTDNLHEKIKQSIHTLRALEKECDRLLNSCQDGECMTCAEIVCPYQDSMHYHHDGCPSCVE